MARKPTKSKPDVSVLFEALKFVNVAQVNDGTPLQTHVKISGGWVVAFDGIVSAGSPVPIDLTACPHSKRLTEALGLCGNEFTISQLDESKLCIQTAKFKAFVPCLHVDTLATVPPDAPCAAINDELAVALDAVHMQPHENDKRIIADTLLVRSGSALGTDGVVLLEYWHGIDLPQLIIPKQFALAICKTKKPLSKLGFSPYSVTVYFDDNSWLRSQLYIEQWPNVDNILNVQTNPFNIPPDFFEGLRHVIHACNDTSVLFSHNRLHSHESEVVGASYIVDGLPAGPCFSARRLLELEHFMKQVDFTSDRNVARFFGNNVRGAIVGMKR